MEATTPKRSGSRRHYIGSGDDDYEVGEAEGQDKLQSPVQTPSPKNQSLHGEFSTGVRRSSTSLGYLSTPLPNKSDRRVSNDFVGESQYQNMNAFLAPNSPNGKTRLLPPTTPKSRNTEVFLSPSPKLKSPGVYKEQAKPIREISNNLKTRLNYALVKLQNGWVDKTLPELEIELDGEQNQHQQSNMDTTKLTESQRRMSTYSNIYANDDYDSNAVMPMAEFGNGNGNNKAKNDSRNDKEDKKKKKVPESKLSIDTTSKNLPAENSTSAHLAFLKAISSPQKQASERLNVSPLKWQNRNSPRKDQPTEEEAIETLMSLSSPKKSSFTNLENAMKPPPVFKLHSNTNSPTEKLSTPVLLTNESIENDNKEDNSMKRTHSSVSQITNYKDKESRHSDIDTDIEVSDS
ncbi:hypothetical protein Kpol_1043p64 [Vanderwaltozyma polyspora DSM 70294]|uniref:Uncharacterized protein n=1 Tax=Vanderwaltozyma polyspora (strain ATCC 22028 / DSM 70294 / BCRC 21397 / CBS 2163 / NBRC 10782 / NRRL Y-8283 / UCD 57-17) TaxID=436907 RepID=A7TIT1_VANPO|nr:uncharacterized protein Kpol_1043p64 [Vanderwaltozyma polyspora DSM 70294]EDO17873.1 hypothetical protein Kpol_1043p64 [Vanderwaltozyma polyspora DSM 70294]